MPTDNWGEYLYNLQRKNPELNNDDTKLTITVGSLKKQLKRAFDTGRVAGKKEGPTGSIDDLLDKLQGR